MKLWTGTAEASFRGTYVRTPAAAKTAAVQKKAAAADAELAHTGHSMCGGVPTKPTARARSSTSSTGLQAASGGEKPIEGGGGRAGWRHMHRRVRGAWRGRRAICGSVL